MPVLWIVLAVFALGGIGFAMARARAVASAGGDTRKLHSLPNYYGWTAILATVVPSLLALAAWLLIAPIAIEGRIAQTLPESAIAEGSSRGLVMAEVRRTADGLTAAVAAG
ncbi:MAG: phosphate ABC transporter permease family protein, partial [Myxococcota bacterium]